MVARRWIVATPIAVALASPACALIFGIEELPVGSGGSGGAGASAGSTSSGLTTSSSSGHTASSSSGQAASSSSGQTASSSSGGGTCSQMTDCDKCTGCMESGPCNLADAGCTSGSPCDTYTQCVIQCPSNASYQACTQGCNSVMPPQFLVVKACLCQQCSSLCPPMCM
jgi:hypothetical protein